MLVSNLNFRKILKAEKLKSKKGEIIEGPILLTPLIFGDDRGFFFESWNNKKLNEILNQNINFVQDNHSSSQHGVIRGLHYQLQPNPQGKLVRCIEGEIFDVAVDIRQESKTFGKWVGCYLNSVNKKQLWVPVGFAHGFLTISDSAEVLYKASGYWSKELERSIIWNDNTINIEWPLSCLKKSYPLLANKDANAPSLGSAKNKGEIL